MNKQEQLQELEHILTGIQMPAPVSAQVMARATADPEAPEDPSEFYGMRILTLHLLEAAANRLDGPWTGIPEIIYLDTLAAFSRFVGEHLVSYGVYGFDRDFWTTRQVSAILFRIGVLEYEFAHWFDEDLISVHIPSDRPLTGAELRSSYDAMRRFMAKYRPEKKDLRCWLGSWLLSPELAKLLPEDSGILRLQSAFDIDTFDPEPKAYLGWCYKIGGKDRGEVRTEDLPENTSLQRRMKAHLLAGGKIGEAKGFMVRPFEVPETKQICLGADALPGALDGLHKEDRVMLQGIADPSRLTQILEECARRKLAVYLTPAPGSPLPDDADLSAVRWLYLEEDQAAQMGDGKAPEALFLDLHKRWPRMNLQIRKANGETESYTTEGEVFRHKS